MVNVRWPRMTLALPITPDLEVRVTMPRYMAADEWARMLELLEAMRPGIVKSDMIPGNANMVSKGNE